MGKVDILESVTEYIRQLRILYFKDNNYLMKTMAPQMALDDLEGNNTKFNYKGRDGNYLVKIFTYCHPFGLPFCHHHQVGDHNNRHHSLIPL